MWKLLLTFNYFVNVQLINPYPLLQFLFYKQHQTGTQLFIKHLFPQFFAIFFLYFYFLFNILFLYFFQNACQINFLIFENRLISLMSGVTEIQFSTFKEISREYEIFLQRTHNFTLQTSKTYWWIGDLGWMLLVADDVAYEWKQNIQPGKHKNVNLFVNIWNLGEFRKCNQTLKLFWIWQ